MVRSVTPMISAASSHVILFAMAFSKISCDFMIRSISAAEYTWTILTTRRLPTEFFNRTDGL
jgi:hypothetical protein